jgi:hypothetical protein
MPFQKGNKHGKGRQRGSQNVTTRISKELTEECFEANGGLAAFAHWADRNRTDFYTRIWTKLFPAQVVGQVTHDHEFAGAREALAYLLLRRTESIRAREIHQLADGSTASAPSIKVPVTNKATAPNTNVTNASVTSGESARVLRWRKGNRRAFNEYMKLYMRDWRCRRAVIRMAGEGQ